MSHLCPSSAHRDPRTRTTLWGRRVEGQLPQVSAAGQLCVRAAPQPSAALCLSCGPLPTPSPPRVSVPAPWSSASLECMARPPAPRGSAAPIWTRSPAGTPRSSRKVSSFRKGSRGCRGCRGCRACLELGSRHQGAKPTFPDILMPGDIRASPGPSGGQRNECNAVRGHLGRGSLLVTEADIPSNALSPVQGHFRRVAVESLSH